MTSERLAAAGAAVAAQDTTLTSLRTLFDQVDFDLRDATQREAQVGRSLDAAAPDLDAARDRLRALGVAVPSGRALPGQQPAPTPARTGLPRYEIPAVPLSDDFGEIVRLSEAHLAHLGIDLTRDPLQQVLPSSQIAEGLRRFSDEHGDITWNRTDWAVVLGAGLLASILDIVLVRIPQDTTFLGTTYSGSPLTTWLQEKDRAAQIHARFFRKFEGLAKVPYDASTTATTGGLVSGMRPATHRLQSLGHDPFLGFLFGVADLMHGTGTYVDKAGRLVQVAAGADPVELITALLTQVRHLLSDVYTPAGLQPPLFSLLQLGTVESPFALGPSGAKVPWTDVSRYMYVHGYDLRHFFTMGITPSIVEATIRSYWLLDSFAAGGTAAQRERDRAKLRSMLLLGHTIATSGTLLKTGLLFGMNPLALNYQQILAMAPATVSWLRESTARDRRIEGALERTWESLLSNQETLN